MKILKISTRLLLLLMLCQVACFAQEIKGKALSALYSDFKKTKSLKSENSFFDEFPNSFHEFQQVYGYDDVKGASPNYKVAIEQVPFFFKTSECVDKAKFSRKLIAITLKGKWDADAENYLQDNLRRYYFLNTTTLLSLLEKLNQTDANSFWYFFCDGPSFDNQLLLKTKRSLIDYPKQEKYLDKMARLAKKNNKE